MERKTLDNEDIKFIIKNAPKVCTKKKMWELFSSQSPKKMTYSHFLKMLELAEIENGFEFTNLSKIKTYNKGNKNNCYKSKEDEKYLLNLMSKYSDRNSFIKTIKDFTFKNNIWR
jgi:hypothetical protein